MKATRKESATEKKRERKQRGMLYRTSSKIEDFSRLWRGEQKLVFQCHQNLFINVQKRE